MPASSTLISEVSWSSWCAVRKNLEPNPRPLDCCNAITFANIQSELSRPVKNDISYVNRLVLGVRSSGDVRELEKFFNGGEYGRYQASIIVDFLLDDVLVLEELVVYQLTGVVLKVIQHVGYGAVDRIGCEVADIR